MWNDLAATWAHFWASSWSDLWAQFVVALREPASIGLILLISVNFVYLLSRLDNQNRRLSALEKQLKQKSPPPS